MYISGHNFEYFLVSTFVRRVGGEMLIRSFGPSLSCLLCLAAKRYIEIYKVAKLDDFRDPVPWLLGHIFSLDNDFCSHMLFVFNGIL